MSTGDRYIWSDLHVGHINLAEKWRPWAGGTVASHNEWLRTVHNDTVRPTDEIWYVGDVCMGNLAESLEFFKTFHGQKFLIPGNHDRCHPSYHGKPEKKAQWTAMYEEVFTILPERVVVDEYIFCHFPWSHVADHAERDLIGNFGPDINEHPDMVLVHGHTHSHERVGERSVHVGVDAWQDAPVHWDEMTATAFLNGFGPTVEVD